MGADRNGGQVVTGPQQRGRTRGDEFSDTLVVLAATAVLLGGFAPLFDGGRWYVVVLSVLVPVAAVALAVRVIAPGWATVVTSLAGIVALVWVFAPGTTFFALPTVSSLAELRGEFGRARTVIMEQAAPITPPDSVLFIVAIAFVVMFVLADAVARQTWRVPLLGALWATMLVVPSIISAEMPPWWVFLGAAAAWLWLWWGETIHVGAVPTGAAVATAAGAVGISLLLPAMAPEIKPTSSDFGVTGSQVFGTGINPMIELGRNLRQSSPRRVLTYTTESSTGVYLKVATLRQFNGTSWSPSPLVSDLDIEGVDDIDPAIEVENVKTTVRIESLRSTYLPVPYPATEIRGLEGDWQWLRDGSTVRAQDGTSSQDQTYSAISVDRLPTAQQMRGVDRAGQSLAAYRALPRDVPQRVIDLAREHAGSETNDYDRMVALQDWMRSNFEYSVEAPVEEGYDGNGLDVMAEFLVKEAGYCVHFASALAVMGRILDVPTRVAVGYAPGDDVLSRSTDTTTYGVDSDDLHAWTEAYFEGVGWIPFDATPGIGEGTAFSEPVAAGGNSDTTSNDDSTNSSGSQDALRPEDGATTQAQTAQEQSSPWRAVVLALATVLLLGAGPAVIRSLRRRRRWAAGRGSTEPLWSEVTDTARDLGMVADPAETPRGFARRLEARGVDAAELETLLVDVERTRYGGTVDVATRVDEARRVVGTLEGSSDLRSRIRARLAPRSLFR